MDADRIIKRVLFVGDPFRGDQAENVRKTRQLFSAVCVELGLQTEELVTEVNWQTEVEQWLPGWQRSMGQRASALADLDLSDSAVIGFELPSAERADLTARGVPWMAVDVHPLRFLDDLYLNVTTSFPCDLSALAASPGALSLQVQALKLRYGLSMPAPHPSTLAIFGQTLIDKSIFYDGKFCTLLDYLPALDAHAQRYDRVFYRPHPYMRDDKLDQFILDRYQAQSHDDRDVYRWLLSGEVDAVCAISSSILEEADCFGLDTFALEPRAARAGHAISLRALIASTQLWAAFLPGVAIPRSLKGLGDAVPANFVRSVFSSWSFVSEKDELNARLSATEAEIHQVRAELAQTQSDLRQAQRVQRIQVLRQARRMRRLQRVVQRDTHDMRAEIHRSQDELHSVYTSRSWRITAPLRWAARRCKALWARAKTTPGHESAGEQVMKERIKGAASRMLGRVNRMLLKHPEMRRRVLASLSRFPSLERRLRILFSQQFRQETHTRSPAWDQPSAAADGQLGLPDATSEFGVANNAHKSPLEREFRRYRNLK